MTTPSQVPARHSKGKQAAPRTALLAFVITALVAAGAGVVVRMAGADAAPVARDSAATSALADFRLGVRATAETEAARFTITSTRVPAQALLTVASAGPAPEREIAVTISSTTTEVVVRGLQPGPASWTVGADGAAPLRGDISVLARKPKPASGSTSDAPPGPKSRPSTVSRPPGSSTPATPKAPQSATPHAPPPSAPAPSPGTPKPSPTPSPTPRPTGPPTPFDPDDH